MAHAAITRVSGTGCAMQEGGAGGQWVRCARGEHAVIAEEHAVLCAVLPCSPDSLAAMSREAGWQAVGGSATQHGTGCSVQVVKESGAGVAGAGCDGAESAADAVSAAPHLRRERVRWGVAMAVGSAPERGDGGEGAPSAR